LSEPLIPGGYILLSRKIIESQIWNKPPLYIKVWVYLLTCAQHKDYKGLKRGQLRTSIPEIQEACSWYVGFRKVVPTKDQIYQVLEWLRTGCAHNDESNTKATMIATTKATQGIVITILNYGHYQDSKSYESNDESNDEKAMKPTRKQRAPNNINKNDKNDKNDNKEIYIELFEFWNSLNITPHKVLTENLIKAMDKAFKNKHTLQDIKTSMSRYAKAYHDRDYYFDHAWKLIDFLSQNNAFPAFLDDGSKWISYQNTKKKSNSSGFLPHEKDLMEGGNS
jgi:hypothetical protein